MTTTRYVLLKEIEESKCNRCSELIRPMGYYCASERQRLDIVDSQHLATVHLHCGGPYRLKTDN